MVSRFIVGSVCLRLIVVALIPAGAARADDAAPAGAPKRLIEFGWDEPDAAFLRKYAAEMEHNTPFNGCVFHVNYTKSEGSTGGGNFMWEGWSKRAFTDAELAKGLADLKAAKFNRMKHNFIRFNVTPGDVD